ncbi:syntaxin-81 [Arachis duranensis]|uniref:Syntaxin-81 n=1 Tax=Arachis duranensis TaxID=130453 RepID=A0A9C6TJY3_ARADU|nr:syntaxin-81 [Arachis duranensis]
MARARDRTEDFKDAVRHSARSLGYDEAKLASVMASFIIHKPPQRSPFSKAALKTERDSIEHEVSVFVKTCQEQIDVLKNSINQEEETSKGWLGITTSKANADTIAHKHGVVLILSEKLHSVSAQFDKLRAVRFQEAINRAMPRRKLNRLTKKDSIETPKSDDVELREPSELHNEPLRVQQQLLDDETRALQVELSNLLDTVQETETKMVEMSALNHLVSTHVLQQAQQIEHLYEQAVEATKNVELGNKELSQAIQRNSSSRTFLILFLFVLTFSVLFLDWYS